MSGILDFFKSPKRVLQKIVLRCRFGVSIPDFTLALPFKQLILERKDITVLRTMYPPRGLKGVEMGYIRERSLSDGSKRFYAEVELKGAGPRLTATFNRRSDAKLWIQKTETELRCGKNQLIAESRKYVFKDAVQINRERA